MILGGDGIVGGVKLKNLWVLCLVGDSFGRRSVFKVINLNENLNIEILFLITLIIEQRKFVINAYQLKL